MAHAPSYAFERSANSALEQWIRRDLRTRYDGALQEDVPNDLLALAGMLATQPQQSSPQPKAH